MDLRLAAAASGLDPVSAWNEMRGGHGPHIVLVAPLPEPDREARGGVERVTEVLMRGLATQARVSVVVPNSTIALRTQTEHGEIRFVKRSRLPGFVGYWTSMSAAVRAELDDLRPDLVHVQDMSGVAMFWPRKGRLSVPWVFTVHGILDEDIRRSSDVGFVRRSSRELRARTVAAVEKVTRSRFDEIVLINPYVREAMPDLAGRSVHSIANPVDRRFLTDAGAAAGARDGFRLVQAGVISSRKNVAGSIAIVSELRSLGVPATLDVVGPVAEPEYFNHCRALVASSGMEEVVTFHDGVRPDALAGWFDRSDMLLLVSTQETAPMVVAEAHCRGLPVAVRPSFGLVHMVKDGVDGGFLAGQSVKADALRLLEMSRMSWSRDEIRASARRRYDPDVIIRQTLALYHDALRRGREHAIASGPSLTHGVSA